MEPLSAATFKSLQDDCKKWSAGMESLQEEWRCSLILQRSSRWRVVFVNLLSFLWMCLCSSFTSRLFFKAELLTCSSLRTLHQRLQLGETTSVPAGTNPSFSHQSVWNLSVDALKLSAFCFTHWSQEILIWAKRVEQQPPHRVVIGCDTCQSNKLR